MKQFTYNLTDPVGLHARPAGLLVKEASRFQSDIHIKAGEKSGDAKRIFTVMTLGAKQGDCLTFTIDGPDEDAAAAALKTFLENNL